jgi:DNA polymerase-3 subunit alpha
MSEGSKSLTAADYVHLHNHTHYSLLDGLQKVEPMLDHAVKLGMKSMAITDHGTLSGAIEFYKAAKARDIKPIIGIETYVASRNHTDKEAGKDKANFHLILLAMNNQGYKNLMRLSTIANLEGYYYKPRIDHELLQKYNEGLIVLSACIGGEVGDAVRQGQYDQAKEIALWYKTVFGDRYYIELQDHGHPSHPALWDEQVRANLELLKLAKELDIKTVVTCDAHYLRHEDQEAHEILLCVQTGSFLDETSRMSLKNFELHVTDPAEIIKRWGAKNPESVSNTAAIAERCNVELELGKILIPKFPLAKGQTEKHVLHLDVYHGLAWRYGGITEQEAAKLTEQQAIKTLPAHVTERAAYELKVIDQMGFNGYFLIIADFINWGKDQGIVFGPGRGSAAGSIIAYSLKITELDPLAYDLLFERFLNPDRISMPDIDIDIQDSRRDEVIQYCVRKYGTNRVANIVTFGRMAARNAVRDVARVLRVPYADADRLSKMIPPPVQGRHIPLKQSLIESQELKTENETNPQSARVFELATKLEGTIRSHGVHAAGVVIAPGDIVEYAPLEMAQKGVIATQYSMGPVEELGLLKMDFLGLSNLTIIKNTLRIIKRVYKVDIDINTIPLDDTLSYELLQRGETTGVFQLESAGMKRYLKELKPSVFDDIIAMVALYRPGPMQFIDSFIKRKHGEEQISYLHPGMENSLKNTYGILVYQEQFMQIAKEWSGFTGGQADTLRKAVGKKNIDLMRKVKVEFVDGAIKHSGASRMVAEKFWDQLEEFANYCFNKSHAACYGMIAYQTAYLKAHYPAAFMAALMTSDYDDTDRLSIEMSECTLMGIKVMPPDVNESFLEFAVVPGESKIRFGMNAIKNVGTAAVEEIIRARGLDGPFKGLEDFFTKVNARTVNRKAIESLIKAGAFDSFEDRGVLLHNIDTLLSFAVKKQKEIASGQTDLFGEAVQTEQNYGPQIVLTKGTGGYDLRDYLSWERELLGLFLLQHPLESYKVLFEEQTMPISSFTPQMDGKRVVIGGAVASARNIVTKNGQAMAFVQLTSLMGDIELILFPSVLQQTIDMWSPDSILIVKGKISGKDRDGNPSSDIKLLVDEARMVTLEQAQAYQATGRQQKVPTVKKTAVVPNSTTKKAELGRLYIRMQSTENHQALIQLKTLMDQHDTGQNEVILIVGEGTSKQAIRLPSRVATTPALIGGLQDIFGSDNVREQ